MLGQASEVFARGDKAGRDARDHEAEKERLERKVGQLAVEMDWLSKKRKQLGIDL